MTLTTLRQFADVLHLTEAFAEDAGEGRDARLNAFISSYGHLLDEPSTTLRSAIANFLESLWATAHDANLEWTEVEAEARSLDAHRSHWRDSVRRQLRLGLADSPEDRLVPIEKDLRRPPPYGQDNTNQIHATALVHAYASEPMHLPVLSPEGAQTCDGPPIDTIRVLKGDFVTVTWTEDEDEACKECVTNTLRWIAEAPSAPLATIDDFFWVSENGESPTDLPTAVNDALYQAYEQERPDGGTTPRFASEPSSDWEILYWDIAESSATYLLESVQLLDLDDDLAEKACERIAAAKPRPYGGGRRREVELLKREASALVATGLSNSRSGASLQLRNYGTRPSLLTRDMEGLEAKLDRDAYVEQGSQGFPLRIVARGGET